MKDILLIIEALSVELDKVYDEINIALNEGRCVKLHLSIMEIECICKDISLNMNKLLKEDPFVNSSEFDDRRVEMELLLSLIKDEDFPVEEPPKGAKIF